MANRIRVHHTQLDANDASQTNYLILSDLNNGVTMPGTSGEGNYTRQRVTVVGDDLVDSRLSTIVKYNTTTATRFSLDGGDPTTESLSGYLDFAANSDVLMSADRGVIRKFAAAGIVGSTTYDATAITPLTAPVMGVQVAAVDVQGAYLNGDGDIVINGTNLRSISPFTTHVRIGIAAREAGTEIAGGFPFDPAGAVSVDLKTVAADDSTRITIADEAYATRTALLAALNAELADSGLDIVAVAGEAHATAVDLVHKFPGPSTTLTITAVAGADLAALLGWAAGEHTGGVLRGTGEVSSEAEDGTQVIITAADKAANFNGTIASDTVYINANGIDSVTGRVITVSP